MPLPPNTKVREIDPPEVSETFVDAVGLATLHGSTLRINLCVHRFSEIKPPAPPQSDKVTVCRLVLSPDGAIELHNLMTNIIGAMAAQGLVKIEEGQPPKAMH
ncbi:MAG TPA: hypothetical protein VEC19_16195 [Usitatibacter sp.]|nr:hypothetical protein [Usitatibacter sp.]